VKRPVVVTDANGQDAIAIRPMANLCLSWDHRAIDGAYAARFLTALRGRIEAV
jgi:pyruvate/2-oxoglutarate dehydrogenase complex dihydrolipoamide acyltransferase (E2) component